MYKEASESAQVLQRQFTHNAELMEKLGAKLRRMQPLKIITCARGSSYHAATFGKYLFEKYTGVFTTSAAPSIISVYHSEMNWRDSICLIISQSGASPDLLAFASAAQKNGALVIAIVNALDSPLATLADEVIPLHAQDETSVAATKSFVASLAALAHLVSAWQSDSALHSALQSAPELLNKAWNCDWSAALDPFSKCQSMFVLGRGVGLGIAQEAALKLKEVCGIHAEAFSSAEVLHGPITIAKTGFPVLTFAQSDETSAGLSTLMTQLLKRGVCLVSAGVPYDCDINLPAPTGHPIIEPMARILSFYRMANDLSLMLKLDPDNPPNLKKVTTTT